MGRDPLHAFCQCTPLVGPSLMGFICFSSAECVGKFFSCAFQFEEMLVKERLLEFLCHFGYFFLNL